MTPDDSNPALIKWGEVSNMGMRETGYVLGLWPTTENTKAFWIGYDSASDDYSRFESIHLHAQTYNYSYTDYDANYLTEVRQFSYPPVYVSGREYRSLSVLRIVRGLKDITTKPSRTPNLGASRI
jgi:hypothetical protein